MNDSAANDITNDDLFQFLNTVGDIADRIHSLPDSRVDPDDVIFVSCVLAGDFPTEELFRADYDGIPNEEDEILLRDALSNSERAIVTDYYVHNMLDDVCACCRQNMAQEDAATMASSKGPH